MLSHCSPIFPMPKMANFVRAGHRKRFLPLLVPTCLLKGGCIGMGPCVVAVCVVVAQGSPLFFLVSCGRASASAVFPLGVQACMAGWW